MSLTLRKKVLRFWGNNCRACVIHEYISGTWSLELVENSHKNLSALWKMMSFAASLPFSNHFFFFEYIKEMLIYSFKDHSLVFWNSSMSQIEFDMLFSWKETNALSVVLRKIFQRNILTVSPHIGKGWSLSDEKILRILFRSQNLHSYLDLVNRTRSPFFRIQRGPQHPAGSKF